MVGVNDVSQQLFGMDNQLLLELLLPARDHQLFNQDRQPLGKRNFRRFRVLIFVIMKQLQNERELLEGAFLGVGRFGGRLAPLHPLVERRQLLPFLRNQAGILLKQRFEITFECQHDLLGLGTRIQLGIGRQVIEEHQRLPSKFPDDALTGQLALDVTTIGPHDRR